MLSKYQVLIAALFVSLGASMANADLLVSAEFQGLENTGYGNVPSYQTGNESLASAADPIFNSSGSTWNALKVKHYDAGTTANPSWSNLVNRGTGAATSVGFSITGDVYSWNGFGGSQTANAVTEDGFFFGVAGASNTVNWSITGLTANATYKLFLYNSDVNWAYARWMNQTVDTDGNGSLANNSAQLVGPDGYGGEFTVVASSAGSILGSAACSGSGVEGDWSGFQIAQVAVPEPCTLTLLATGLIGLLAYAWRKAK